MNRDFISSGSTIIPNGSSALIRFSTSEVNNVKKLDVLENKSIKVLEENKWIDVPLLMEKLNINSETSIKVMKGLREKGIIVLPNEI